MKVHEPVTVDSVHETVDLFYGISFMKIILKMPKVAGVLEFCKNTPNFSEIIF
jgi:hypothetical protein